MKNKILLTSVLLLFIFSNCSKKDNLPIVTTADITNISYYSANCGGVIANDAGDSIISRGVCWSTNDMPKIADSKTTDGAGSGSYISSIINLNPDTKYYVRAYASNSSGTGYGFTNSFTTLAIGPTDIRIRNLSTVTMSNLIVNTSGEYNYGTLNASSVSDYHKFDKAYAKANISAYINSQKFKTDTAIYTYMALLGPVKATYEIYIENETQKKLSIFRVIIE